MSAVLEITKTSPTVEVFQNGQALDARLISVAEYDRIIEHGILTNEDKVELLNGVIIKKMPKGAKRASANSRIARFFITNFDGQVVVRNQNPIWLDEFSEPEPDFVLCRPPREQYLEKHPTPKDILLVMEISDTTLAYDRDDKAQAYSRNGIVQYLLLNLQNETVEDYRQPNADGYGSKQTYRRGDKFNLVAFPEIEIKVKDLF